MDDGAVLASLLERVAGFDGCEVWRLNELVRAGYGYRAAVELAGRRDVDVHVAVGLLEHGCPVRLAERILT